MPRRFELQIASRRARRGRRPGRCRSTRRRSSPGIGRARSCRNRRVRRSEIALGPWDRAWRVPQVRRSARDRLRARARTARHTSRLNRRTQPCEAGRPSSLFVVGAVQIDVALERVAAVAAIDALLEPIEGEDAGQDRDRRRAPRRATLAGRLARDEHRAERRAARRSAADRGASQAACGTSLRAPPMPSARSTPATRRPAHRLRAK